jgi:hypothetical protein
MLEFLFEIDLLDFWDIIWEIRSDFSDFWIFLFSRISEIKIYFSGEFSSSNKL